VRAWGAADTERRNGSDAKALAMAQERGSTPDRIRVLIVDDSVSVAHGIPLLLRLNADDIAHEVQADTLLKNETRSARPFKLSP
jgi:hypothetical protein